MAQPPTIREAPDPGAETVDDAQKWGALLARSFMRFAVESEEPTRFRGTFHVRGVADMEFIGMRTDRHVSHRDTASIAADQRADYLLCLQLEGEGEFTQGPRAAIVRPGDVTVFDATEPATVASTDGYRSLLVRVPHHLLDVPRGDMAELTATRFAADDGLTPAVASLLTTFDRVSDRMPQRVRTLAAHNALDLVTTLLRSTLGPHAHTPRTGAADLDDMLGYVERHLYDPDLGPAVLAAAHFMSLRRAHALFHDAGLTIAAHILRRRLERCRRELVDPARASDPVAAIGLRWGFSTPSAFGRAFRDAFGQSPAAYRAQVLQDDPAERSELGGVSRLHGREGMTGIEPA